MSGTAKGTAALRRRPAAEVRAEAKARDAFFTTEAAAQRCVEWMLDYCRERGITAEDYTWVEPSAGSGRFVRAAENAGLDVRAMDICPVPPDLCETRDFLTTRRTDFPEKWVCFGNPPFGRQGRSSIRFINHALLAGAEAAMFVGPGVLQSWKGQRGAMLGIGVIKTLQLGSKGLFAYPDGSSYEAGNCVLQVWGNKGGSLAKRGMVQHPDFECWFYKDCNGAKTRGRPASPEEKISYYHRMFREKEWDLFRNGNALPPDFRKPGEEPGVAEIGSGGLFFRGEPEVIDRIENMDWSAMREEKASAGFPIGTASPLQVFQTYTKIYGKGKPISQHPDFSSYRLTCAGQKAYERDVRGREWNVAVALTKTASRVRVPGEFPQSHKGVGIWWMFRCSPKVAERIRTLDYDKMSRESRADGCSMASLAKWRIVKAYTERYGPGDTSGEQLLLLGKEEA